MSARGRLFLYRVLFGALLLVLWEGASGRLIDRFWVSSPSKVFGYLAEVVADGSIFHHAAVTFYEAVSGFLLGALSGVGFGFLLARRETLAAVLDPYIAAFNGIPRIALAPLFINYNTSLFSTTGALGGILVLAAVVVLCNEGLERAEARLLRWRPREDGRSADLY